MNHPASGITSFTYDALCNVLTKQTANLAKEGKFITYDYDYQRLTGINYPDHPENNGSHALVTTVTDALHNVQATHTNGSGKTLKTIQKSGPDGDITTSFELSGNVTEVARSSTS